MCCGVVVYKEEDQAIIFTDNTTDLLFVNEELATAGVKEDVVRLSVGIEHIGDILAGIGQALEATTV